MKDYGISVLDQYEIDVDSTRRTRGAVLCNTDKGLFLLKELHMPGERLPILIEIYQYLERQGFSMIDMPMANREGEYLSKAEDGTTYMLKRWFQGRECDMKKEDELVDAVRQLARLHKSLQYMDIKDPEREDETLLEKIRRHNRELRKVNRYVCRCSVKREFEVEFLKGFPRMYRQAELVQELAEQAQIDGLYEESLKNGSFIHGDYNYHNVLICPQGTAVTDFTRVHQGVQMDDLYYFLRKVLEKKQYDIGLGVKLLRAYDSELPLEDAKREYLAIRLAYPEKFWKIVNNYYQSNKAWIPQKNVEKLKNTFSQIEKKRLFLSQIFALKL